MAPQFRAVTASPEVLSVILSTHVMATNYNSSSRGYKIRYEDVHVGKTTIHINNNNNKCLKHHKDTEISPICKIVHLPRTRKHLPRHLCVLICIHMCVCIQMCCQILNPGLELSHIL